MTRRKAAALLLAMLVGGLALIRPAMATHESNHKAFSGGSGFKGLVVKTDQQQTSVVSVFPDWQTVDSRGFQIPAGESQLILVDFIAETGCTGTGGHCNARALVGPTLATAHTLEPNSGGDFVFDAPSDSPESHAMSRALCVRNATDSPLDVSVWLQAQRASNDVTVYSLDDWTLKIARHTPCSPFVDI